jgi:hypothetical protein
MTNYVSTLDSRYNVSPTNKALSDGSPVDLFSVSVGNLEHEVIRIIYNITCIKGNDIQNHLGEAVATIVADGTGAVTANINDGNELTVASTGTLTDSWSATAAAGPVSPVTFAVNANTSLAAALDSFVISYSIHSMTNPAITYI